MVGQVFTSNVVDAQRSKGSTKFGQIPGLRVELLEYGVVGIEGSLVALLFQILELLGHAFWK